MLEDSQFWSRTSDYCYLDAEAVTAYKVDQIFLTKSLVVNEAYLSQLFAKQAFINWVQSVAIDASQVHQVFYGDRIYGGTI